MKARAQIDAIKECAGQWILRRDRGDLTAEDQVALEAWLSADSTHRETYLKLAELWGLAGTLKVWRPADGHVDPQVLATSSQSGRRSRRRPALLAAVVLLAVVGSSLLYVQSHRSVYSTNVGGFQRVALDDGSVLQLNTDSKVRVRLSAHSREVRLLQGEAYFDIAHDARRPFDVIARGTVVRALGTAFVVRLREAERVDVLVAQGRVAIREKAAGSIVEAGQAAEARPSGIRSTRLDAAEVKRRLAWQSGVLHFKDEPLGTVVAELNRYNRRQLQIVDEGLADLEVGGSFRANDLESFIVAVRGVRGIRVDESDDRIFLSRPPP